MQATHDPKIWCHANIWFPYGSRKCNEAKPESVTHECCVVISQSTFKHLFFPSHWLLFLLPFLVLGKLQWGNACDSCVVQKGKVNKRLSTRKNPPKSKVYEMWEFVNRSVRFWGSNFALQYPADVKSENYYLYCKISFDLIEKPENRRILEHSKNSRFTLDWQED